MKRKKILHFIHSMGIGGAQVLVKDYAILLDKEKYDVSVLCLDRENTFLDKILEDSLIHVVYVSDYLPFRKFRLLNNFLLRLFGKIGILKLIVKNIIQNEKPDILHFHLLCSSYVKYANLPKTCALIHTIHSQPEKYWCVKQRFARNDFKALNFLIHTHGVQLIALNDNARIVSNKLFDVDNTIVLNNAIDFRNYNVPETKEQIRKSIGISNDRFLVGNIGRFSPVKNHSLMVKAFAELSKEKNNAHLLLIGDGELRSQIEEEINSLGIGDRVTILGAQNNVARFLKALDVFIFPSLYEGLGIVLIEAQKMGVPCVISNAIPQEAVVSNLVCRMRENATPAEYANSLMKFCVEKVQYYGLEKWDMAVVIKQLENIYAKCLSEGT
jgi:glycosyltransferase involved in cell wall biosynthesis